MRGFSLCGCCLLLTHVAFAFGEDSVVPDSQTGDALLEEYFEQQVSQIEDATFADIDSLEDWQSRRSEYRRQLAEMLGLDPLPQRTPLKPIVTGRLDHDEFTVEKLHFQSLPGLYVTGNLYIPKGLQKPAPTVLYVCGHARVKEDGVSYGGKVAYQHHAIWFARHGYVCLIIDTLQLGEIEGIHHGTYREGMWWWQSRGYTSAGVEAWNCIRALDYLESRPEVDATRFGVTGRSGGGAYSWWIAALDERIQVAVPVAGITSLRNHLLGPFQTTPWSRGETHGHDGCIEGHCDCMFYNNTYRWDFPMLAALVAPRPLLISNTDKDRIFPLDGVVDVYTKVQQIYDLYGATDKLGLQICEGPHKDTQQLRVHAFQWFNRYLKGEEPLIDVPAEKQFEPQQLRVFDELPSDQRNTAIHDTFVPVAELPPVPETEQEWTALRKVWMEHLRTSVFGGWPQEGEIPPLDIQEVFATENHGVGLRVYEFTSEEPYRLQMWVITRPQRELTPRDRPTIRVLDESSWLQMVAEYRGVFPDFKADSGIEPSSALRAQYFRNADGPPTPHAGVYLMPRGVGETAWTANKKERTHIKRRMALLGQTLDGQRVWDIVRGMQAVNELRGSIDGPLSAGATGEAADWLLAASLFDSSIETLTLNNLSSPSAGPIYLNVRRDLPTTALLTLAADDADVRITTQRPQEWQPVREATRHPWFHNQVLIDVITEADE